MSSRQSLWNHKQRCADKSPLEVKEDYFQPESVHDVVQKSKKTNSKIQAFLDNVINGSSNASVITKPTLPKEDDLPTPSVTDNIFQTLEGVNRKPLRAKRKRAVDDDEPRQKRKLPSLTPSEVDDIYNGIQNSSNSDDDDDGDDDNSSKSVGSDNLPRKGKFPSSTPSRIDGLRKFSKSDDDNDNSSTNVSDMDTDDYFEHSSNDDDNGEDDDSSNSTPSVSSIKTEVGSREDVGQKEYSSDDEASIRSSDDDDDEVEGIEGLPVDDLITNFIQLYQKFECDRTKDKKTILLAMLNELKRQKEISKEHYSFLIRRIKKIYKNPALVPTVKCITNEIIDSDIKQLYKVLAEIKTELSDDDRVVKLEKLLGADEYIDGKAVLPTILNEIDGLGDSVKKSMIYRLKSLVTDIEKNKHRIVTIFNRLESVRDKEDARNILKQLASEGLLSTEQYNSLSQLDELKPHSIAIIIKGTKIGQGLMHIPTKIGQLRNEFLKVFKEYPENKHTPALARLVKLLEELFRRDGISKKQYEYIKKNLNIL